MIGIDNFFILPASLISSISSNPIYMELKSAAQLILSPRYQLREHGRISDAGFNVARSIIPGLAIALFALCH